MSGHIIKAYHTVTSEYSGRIFSNDCGTRCANTIARSFSRSRLLALSLSLFRSHTIVADVRWPPYTHTRTHCERWGLIVLQFDLPHAGTLRETWRHFTLAPGATLTNNFKLISKRKLTFSQNICRVLSLSHLFWEDNYKRIYGTS